MSSPKKGSDTVRRLTPTTNKLRTLSFAKTTRLVESMGTPSTCMGNLSKRRRTSSNSASDMLSLKARAIYTCRSNGEVARGFVHRHRSDVIRQHRRKRKPLTQPHPTHKTSSGASMPGTGPPIFHRAKFRTDVHQPSRRPCSDAPTVHP